MNLDQARAHLAKIQPKSICSLCKTVSPETKEAVDSQGAIINIHLGCREKGLFWGKKVVRWDDHLVEIEDLRDALETIVSLYEELPKLKALP